MDSIPASWAALCGLAVALGMRHGFDADHLATIDGIARCHARARPRLARNAGLLFSLGHGAVVLVVAATAYAFASHWQTPRWLEISGAVISIAFLFGLAFLNFRAVLRAPPGAVVAPCGLKGKLFGRIVDVERPWAVAAVGALFALSFDTISQAALFALAAGRLGGMGDALFVAALFVLGMIVVDGANGLWISRLLQRADRTAALVSRIMALAVAALSAAIGMVALVKLGLPAVDAWTDAHGLAIGLGFVAVLLAAFAASMHAASRRRPALVRMAGAD